MPKTPRIKKNSETTISIDELKPDEKNFKRPTSRGVSMIADSLREGGAGRSVLIDEKNKLIAGNKTTEAAKMVGIRRVRVIEADGDEIIAVRRRNLTEKQKRRMAAFDNRTTELSEWDRETLLEATEEDKDIFDGIISDDELNEMLGTPIEEGNKDEIPGMELEPYESYDYIVLLFRNPLDYQNAVEAFGLDKRKVDRKTAKGKIIRKVGMGRCVPGEKFIEILEKKR